MGSLAGLDELFPPGLVDGDEDDGDGAEMVAVLRMMRGGGRDGGGDPRRADHEMKPILISKAFEAQMMRQWAEEDRRGKGRRGFAPTQTKLDQTGPNQIVLYSSNQTRLLYSTVRAILYCTVLYNIARGT